MASFISTNETLERRQNGVISRTGGKVTNRVLEETAGVGAGLFVCPSGTAGIACEHLDAAGDAAVAIGVTVFRPMSYDADLTDGNPHYAENEVVCILEEGYIFVEAEDTVVAEAPVFARHTASGGNTTLGKVRADADTATAAAVPNAYFAESRTGAGLVEIRVGAPNR